MISTGVATMESVIDNLRKLFDRSPRTWKRFIPVSHELQSQYIHNPPRSVGHSPAGAVIGIFSAQTSTAAGMYANHQQITQDALSPVSASKDFRLAGNSPETLGASLCSETKPSNQRGMASYARSLIFWVSSVESSIKFGASIERHIFFDRAWPRGAEPAPRPRICQQDSSARAAHIKACC